MSRVNFVTVLQILKTVLSSIALFILGITAIACGGGGQGEPPPPPPDLPCEIHSFDEHADGTAWLYGW
jgi:hypothetical protein